MKYVLLDYVGEGGWPQLTRDEQKHWLTAYKAYMEAMTKAGVLKNTVGLAADLHGDNDARAQ